jgi:hypothetical protein
MYTKAVPPVHVALGRSAADASRSAAYSRPRQLTSVEKYQMKVYRIQTDVNRFQYFLPEREEDALSLLMDCTPIQTTWQAPPIFIYKPRLIAGDFYSFSGGTLITSPRASEALATFLEMAGEVLPLPYKTTIFTLLNVTECIDCLDHDRSEWLVDEATGVRLLPTKYVFHPERFSTSRLFKIPETCRGEILVVDRDQGDEEEFLGVVRQEQLQGLEVTELWSDGSETA